MRFFSINDRTKKTDIVDRINDILADVCKTLLTGNVFFFEIDFTKNEFMTNYEFDNLVAAIKDVPVIIFAQDSDVERYLGLPRSYVEVCRDFEKEAAENFANSITRSESGAGDMYDIKHGECQDGIAYVILLRRDF